MLDDEDGKEIMRALVTGLTFKAEMIVAGEMQRSAVCPRCDEATLEIRLAGLRNHLRMMCTACKFSMME